MDSSKSIKSVLKAANILKSLSQGVSRVTDLSKQLHLNKSTAYRLLRSLEIAGLVSQDPINHQYYLAPLAIEIGNRPILNHQKLIMCASQEMRHLRDLTGETVGLFIRMGLERICIEEIQSLQEIKHTIGKGFVTAIYAGSSGKLLLSELGKDELQLLLKNIALIPIGPNTTTDKKLLLKELKQIKKQGYAKSFGERVPGSASISVPVADYICPVALSVLGPDYRLSQDVMMGFLKQIKDCSSRISKKVNTTNL